jgi:hypothetical protein
MHGPQNQRGQPRISSFGLVINVQVEPVCGIRQVVGDYSKVKGSLVEESTVHVILCLEQALLHG